MNIIDQTVCNICNRVNQELEKETLDIDIVKLIESLATYRSLTTETFEDKKENGLARMRTAKDCIAYIKEKDPDSKITESILRAKAKKGEVKAVKSGNRTYFNLDTILEELSSCSVSDNKPQNYGKIRPVY